jgi:hypothetical protein
LRQSRTLHTLTFGPISGVHFIDGKPKQEAEVTLQAIARELSDDDLAAIAVGADHEVIAQDAKPDPSKLN